MILDTSWNKGKSITAINAVFGALGILTGALMLCHNNYAKPLGTLLIFAGLMAFIRLVKKRCVRIALTIVNVVATIVFFYFYGQY